MVRFKTAYLCRLKSRAGRNFKTGASGPANVKCEHVGHQSMWDMSSPVLCGAFVMDARNALSTCSSSTLSLQSIGREAHHFIQETIKDQVASHATFFKQR